MTACVPARTLPACADAARDLLPRLWPHACSRGRRPLAPRCCTPLAFRARPCIRRRATAWSTTTAMWSCLTLGGRSKRMEAAACTRTLTGCTRLGICSVQPNWLGPAPLARCRPVFCVGALHLRTTCQVPSITHDVRAGSNAKRNNTIHATNQFVSLPGGTWRPKRLPRWPQRARRRRPRQTRQPHACPLTTQPLGCPHCAWRQAGQPAFRPQRPSLTAIRPREAQTAAATLQARMRPSQRPHHPSARAHRRQRATGRRRQQEEQGATEAELARSARPLPGRGRAASRKFRAAVAPSVPARRQRALARWPGQWRRR
jgi:hypothetical protein